MTSEEATTNNADLDIIMEKVDPNICTELNASAPSVLMKACVVGSQNKDNTELNNALKMLDVEVIYSDDGRDIADASTMSDAVEIVFICEPFEGKHFDYLWKEDHRIVGPSVIYNCAKENLPLPWSSRPLYCTSMSNIVVCFTGFKEKSKLSNLCALVHYMGGSVRKDFNGRRVTHLVANSASGEKYRAAVGLGTSIMTEEWVHKCWDMRSNLTWNAENEEMMDYKLPPFFECCLTFVGFPEEEKAHMEETTIEQGGTFCSLEDKRFSHVVVEDSVKEIPQEALEVKNVEIVRQEWFWASIQVDARADSGLYLFKQTTSDTTRCGTPLSNQKNRKRRRMKETDVMELLSPANSPCHAPKRKSNDILSVSSFSGSLLDYTMASPGTPREDMFSTPTNQLMPDNETAAPLTAVSPLKPKTAREQVALELLQTERNYVEILNTILKVFKHPLEQEDQRAGPILAAEEIKTIFGYLPDILQVHHQMMVELENLLSCWTEDKCIGNVILKHADVLMKVYPVFVNFFEMSKETVMKCDRERPRFHAFLKICLSKPECGRQTLAELLIRPVQRLPSMNLLLTDLLKQTRKTDSNNPDILPLEKAIEALKSVMTHINEYKRKTDSQVQMFEIIQDIDNCPPNILSSHRCCVAKMDGFELSDVFCGKAQPVTMFLFSDSLEVTKRRSNVNKNSATSFPMKSPASKTPQRAYKHLEFIPLSQLRKVVDIIEQDENHDLFGFMYRSSDMIERFAMLRLVSDEISKELWLEKLVNGLANAASIANRAECFTTLDASTLAINKSDLALTNQSKIGRAVRVAKKTTKKVSRAFSMNKTPRSKVNLVKRSNSNVSPGGISLSGSPLRKCTKENLRTRLLGTGEEPKVKELKSDFKAMSQYMSSPSLLPGKT
ncbi:protein ECT2-like [Xenia sp. Carnegie-2017]|uniref:protein ECT2-like n=1 Tax=Xenia sp. Carnegie-2017 TaxID=2897299 RepID=UPI001F04FFD9|nr:protein ECT2-like [Xenia sp. Carnegie-2017]